MKIHQYPALTLVLTVLLLSGCTPRQSTGSDPTPKLVVRPFGITSGDTARLFILRNSQGMEVRLTNYGGIITHLIVPDREGKPADVALGYDSLAPYLSDRSYFGALIGRYANRIGHASFSLDGKTYTLEANNGGHSLHGGNSGFHQFLYQAAKVERAGYWGVELSRRSPAGEGGYPGNLSYSVRYLLGESNQLRIEYEATTDAPTVINLTNHTYFNLRGAGSKTILDHTLTVRADYFTPVDEGLIPSGEIRSVAGTPFDFRSPRRIGSRIDDDSQQLAFGGGYDHNWVLARKGPGLEFAARLEDTLSGRTMEVWTTKPGLQFYSGNFLDGSLRGKDGKSYAYRSGLCLETQYFPDSPNKDNFPSTVLRPGETYHAVTEYRFGW